MDVDGRPPGCIQLLPDEMLLDIFRRLSASDLLISVAFVCQRWLKLVVSDSRTLKRVGMAHFLSGPRAVQFFFDDDDERMLFRRTPDEFDQLLFSDPRTSCVDYTKAFYLCTQYSELYEQISTLVISTSLRVYPTEGFTYVNGLTTLVFFRVAFAKKDLYTLTELGSVYSAVENVSYIGCRMFGSDAGIFAQHLHGNFKRLKRFRMDHYSISHRLLEDLLTAHRHTLETVVLGDFTILGDRWIDVLTTKLRGRTLLSLSMHSSYFTDKCVASFLTSDFITDKSTVIINNDKVATPFSLTIAV